MDWIIKPDDNQEQDDSYVAACQGGMTGACPGECCGDPGCYDYTPCSLKLW